MQAEPRLTDYSQYSSITSVLVNPFEFDWHILCVLLSYLLVTTIMHDDVTDRQ